MPKSKSKKRRELWVIKAGSQMVIEGGALLIREWMHQVMELSKSGVDVIWVTSGAIATARVKTKREPKRLSEKQALSAIGQPLVLDQYSLALQTQGKLAAQVLLTAEDLRHRTRRANLMGTLSTLLEWGVLPIINENDTVSTDEIQFGDNDRLSALVAKHMGAKRLVLLTDVNGLYESDPRKNPNAMLVPHLKRVTPKLLSGVSPASLSGRGKGGMLSKLMAAREAGKDGITTHLVKGDTPKALTRIQDALQNRGTMPGTLIGEM